VSRASIPDKTRELIRTRAAARCEYCRAAQSLVFAPLEIEHIVPSARGGDDAVSNLCLSCRMCNSYKGARVDAIDVETGLTVPLYNPRIDHWSAHFTWIDCGVRIQGLTSCGRATVLALRFNSLLAVEVRRRWVLAGWHPPDDATE
jgi:hypothetical protein